MKAYKLYTTEDNTLSEHTTISAAKAAAYRRVGPGGTARWWNNSLIKTNVNILEYSLDRDLYGLIWPQSPEADAEIAETYGIAFYDDYVPERDEAHLKGTHQ